ncbi:MAG: hypothetical protein JW994_02170, partial [Candidatus Omnitrophica bacterium]|nr:hypothetical protein [Candidatus Omnitrophota bacterium]
MLQYSIKYKIFLRIIAITVIHAFILSDIAYAASDSFKLAAWTATERSAFLADAEGIRLFRELGGRLKFATDENGGNELLAQNSGASAVLLSHGKILASEKIKKDTQLFLRTIIQAETIAIMQVMATEEPGVYGDIREKVFSNDNLLRSYEELYPASANLSRDARLNDMLARAFVLLVLKRRSILTGKDFTPKEKAFIKAVEPVIKQNKNKFFTSSFWDSDLRGFDISVFLANGHEFQETTVIPSPAVAAEPATAASGGTANEQPEDIDMRPVTYGLLPRNRVGFNQSLHQLISSKLRPDGRAIYGGSGVDVSNFLLTVDVPEAYFVDTQKLDFRILKYLVSSESAWDSCEECGHPAFGKLVRRYIDFKGKTGYGGSHRGGNIYPEYLLVAELKSMGIRREDIITMDQYVDGALNLRFRWSRSGRADDSRVYSITWIPADITKPSSYPDRLKDILAAGYDIYYQNAGFSIAMYYERFIHALVAGLRARGLLVTDDYYLDEDPKSLLVRENPIGQYLSETGTFEYLPFSSRMKAYANYIEKELRSMAEPTVELKIFYGWKSSLSRLIQKAVPTQERPLTKNASYNQLRTWVSTNEENYSMLNLSRLKKGDFILDTTTPWKSTLFRFDGISSSCDDQTAMSLTEIDNDTGAVTDRRLIESIGHYRLHRYYYRPSEEGLPVLSCHYKRAECAAAEQATAGKKEPLSSRVKKKPIRKPDDPYYYKKPESRPSPWRGVYGDSPPGMADEGIHPPAGPREIIVKRPFHAPAIREKAKNVSPKKGKWQFTLANILELFFWVALYLGILQKLPEIAISISQIVSCIVTIDKPAAVMIGITGFFATLIPLSGAIHWRRIKETIKSNAILRRVVKPGLLEKLKPYERLIWIASINVATCGVIAMLLSIGAYFDPKNALDVEESIYPFAGFAAMTFTWTWFVAQLFYYRLSIGRKTKDASAPQISCPDKKVLTPNETASSEGQALPTQVKKSDAPPKGNITILSLIKVVLWLTGWVAGLAGLYKGADVIRQLIFQSAGNSFVIAIFAVAGFLMVSVPFRFIKYVNASNMHEKLKTILRSVSLSGFVAPGISILYHIYNVYVDPMSVQAITDQFFYITFFLYASVWTINWLTLPRAINAAQSGKDASQKKKKVKEHFSGGGMSGLGFVSDRCGWNEFGFIGSVLRTFFGNSVLFIDEPGRIPGDKKTPAPEEGEEKDASGEPAAPSQAADFITRAYGGIERMAGLNAIELGPYDKLETLEYFRTNGIDVHGVGISFGDIEIKSYLHCVQDYNDYLARCEPNSMDFIYGTASIYTFENSTNISRRKRKAAIINRYSKIVRMLKPGGVFVVGRYNDEENGTVFSPECLKEDEIRMLGLELVSRYAEPDNIVRAMTYTVMRKSSTQPPSIYSLLSVLRQVLIRVHSKGSSEAAVPASPEKPDVSGAREAEQPPRKEVTTGETYVITKSRRRPVAELLSMYPRIARLSVVITFTITTFLLLSNTYVMLVERSFWTALAAKMFVGAIALGGGSYVEQILSGNEVDWNRIWRWGAGGSVMLGFFAYAIWFPLLTLVFTSNFLIVATDLILFGAVLIKAEYLFQKKFILREKLRLGDLKPTLKGFILYCASAVWFTLPLLYGFTYMRDRVVLIDTACAIIWSGLYVILLEYWARKISRRNISVSSDATEPATCLPQQTEPAEGSLLRSLSFGGQVDGQAPDGQEAEGKESRNEDQGLRKEAESPTAKSKVVHSSFSSQGGRQEVPATG